MSVRGAERRGAIFT